MTLSIATEGYLPATPLSIATDGYLSAYQVVLGGGKYTGKVEVYDLDILLKKIKDSDIRKEAERLLKTRKAQEIKEKKLEGKTVEYTLPAPIAYNPLVEPVPLYEIEDETDREIARLIRIREMNIYNLIQQIHAEEVLKQEEEVFLLLMLL